LVQFPLSWTRVLPIKNCEYNAACSLTFLAMLSFIFFLKMLLIHIIYHAVFKSFCMITSTRVDCQTLLKVCEMKLELMDKLLLVCMYVYTSAFCTFCLFFLHSFYLIVSSLIDTSCIIFST